MSVKLEISDSACESLIIGILTYDLDIAEGEDRKAIIQVLKYYMNPTAFKALNLECKCECSCGVK